MKTTELLVKLIKKLQANGYYECTTVISVILHAYKIKCALEETPLEFDEWLQFAANIADYNDDWFDEQLWLYYYRHDLARCCKDVPMSMAIDKIKHKYCIK